MDISNQLLSAAPSSDLPCCYVNGIIASGKPQDWGKKADFLLLFYYAKHPIFDIDLFKRCIYDMDLNAYTTPRIDPGSYDLVFLQSRLAELLGPCIDGIDTEIKRELGVMEPGSYFRQAWKRVAWGNCSGGRTFCIRCTVATPAIFENMQSRRLRCGHCGNMDLRRGMKIEAILDDCFAGQVEDEERQRTLQRVLRLKASTNNVGLIMQQSEYTVSYPPMDLNTPSKRNPKDIPLGWSDELDAHLKEWYILEPRRFDVGRFKASVDLLRLECPDLCVDSGSYDLVFLHDRLEYLSLPCVCRLNEDSWTPQNLDGKPCYIHKDWREIIRDERGHRLFCAKCKVVPPLICTKPLRTGLFRCGSCGDGDVGRMPSEESYFEHWDSVFDSFVCINQQKMAAGLPPIAQGRINIEVKKEMWKFQREHRFLPGPMRPSGGLQGGNKP